MTSLLGQATHQRSLVLNRKSQLHEYQSNLTAYLPKAEEQIEVKEYEWKSPEKTVVVWMLKRDNSWYVVDSLIWSENIRF